MKNLSKKLVAFILVMLALLSITTTVAAAYNITLDVGEEYSFLQAETPYVSSDPSVVEIRDDGNKRYTAVGVSEGTATVSGTFMDDSMVYEFKVVDPEKEQLRKEQAIQEQKERAKNSGTNAQNFSAFFEGTGIGSFFKGQIIFAAVGFFLVCGFIVFVIILIMASMKKAKRLDFAMQQLAANPCQQTAEAAVQEFTNVKGVVRINIANGSDTRGVHFTMWRDVFNRVVIPCRTIRAETKEALRQALIRLNTHSLHTVNHVQTTGEAKEAAEAFGAGGEQNVWHNLKSLQGCDVYRNVKLYNGNTASEIDAVIVDENKGIFLIEVKSVGGVKDISGNKVIAYNMLKEDPSNQIYRHEYDFKTCFGNLEIGNKIKNVLVFSWPNGDTRRLLAKNTFPQTDYDIITVEQLMGYHRAQPGAMLSPRDRAVLAEKLKYCSSECFVR